MNESGHEVAAATMVDPVLRSCAVFAALDARALGRLSATTGRHSYDEGQIVFQQGDAGDCMYVVARGSVEISVQDPTEASPFWRGSHRRRRSASSPSSMAVRVLRWRQPTSPRSSCGSRARPCSRCWRRSRPCRVRL